MSSTQQASGLFLDEIRRCRLVYLYERLMRFIISKVSFILIESTSTFYANAALDFEESSANCRVMTHVH